MTQRNTVEGELTYGLQVGDETHTHYVLREPTTGDMFAAEEIAPVDRVLAYRGALIATTLVRLGSEDGPFTLAQIRKLHPVDFNALVEAQTEVEALGKGGSAAG